MKKIAFFVEGQTEAIFTRRLISELASERDIRLQLHKLSNGPLTILTNQHQQGDEKYYALICDCGNDSSVKTKIIENAEGLSAQGFDKIIGLRDLRPGTLAELRKYRRLLPKGLQELPVPTEIIIAVREIEAWFIAEWRHFRNIHHSLTPHRIWSSLQVDVRTHDVRAIDEPYELLRASYAIFKIPYSKKAKQVRRIMDAISFEHFYDDVRQRVEEVDQFITAIEDFL